MHSEQHRQAANLTRQSGAAASVGKSVAAMSHRTGFVENLAAAGTKNAVERVVRLGNPKVAEQWPSVSLHAAR